MDNVLYNVVELQDINTVWTDKTARPYASIVQHTDGTYVLILSDKSLGYRNGVYFSITDTPTTADFWIYAGSEWGFGATQTHGGYSLSEYSFVWASYPVPNINTAGQEDGTIHLEMADSNPDESTPDKPTPDEPTLAIKPYLTFASEDDFVLCSANNNKSWDGIIEWSNDLSVWNEWDGVAELSSAEHDGEQRIYLRGTGNTNFNESGFSFTEGDAVRCEGTLETLLDYATVESGGHPEYESISHLFKNCTILTAAPDLPVTMGYVDCCEYMFYGCTSLVTPPKLPATTLTEGCYRAMFAMCESLRTAPELPATILADSCYRGMFDMCVSLVTPPELPVTTLAEYCYARMFAWCRSLKTAPELPATTLATACYNEMFEKCTSLTTLPELPATTLARVCYQCMFEDCTRIKVSETQTDECWKEYRIPSTGEGAWFTTSYEGYDAGGMFSGTGGAFVDIPKLNTVYYIACPLPPSPAEISRKSIAMITGFQKGLSVKNIRTKLLVHVGPNPPEDTNLLWVNNPTELPCSTFNLDTDAYRTFIEPAPLSAPIGQSTAATLDDKIWYCGGWGPWPGPEDDWTRNDEICCYDPATNTRTVLDVKLPQGLCRVALVVIGKKIYMFGGQGVNRKLTDQILVLDTTDLSLTTLDVTLPVASYRYAASVGETVYLFGGYNGDTELDEILAFDTSANTIRMLDTKLPGPAWALGVAAVGDRIYIFGGQVGTSPDTGYSHILRFDPTDESLTTMNATLPNVHMNPTPVVVGNNIWLLGGYRYTVSGVALYNFYDSIDIYHPDKDYLAPSGITLSEPCAYMPAGLVGGSIYTLGGMATKDVYSDSAYAFDVMPKLKPNRVYVEPIVNNSYPQVSLFAGSTKKYGVRKIGMLTDEGYFDVPEAYVYKDGEWVYAYTDESASAS